MKSKIIIGIVTLVFTESFLSPCSYAQNLLNNPESVVFDAPRDRYIVSNWGDGSIIQIDSNGTQSYFST